MHKKSIVSYLIKKYLRFDKGQPFITVSAVLAFLGVALGLMVLMVAMAIMNGFDKEFERKLFTMNYPLTIHSFGLGGVSGEDLADLEKKFPNLLMSPFISTQAIAKHKQRLEGVLLFGVDFEREKKINSVVQKALNNNTIGKYEVLLGSGIKDMFFLLPNDKLTLIFTSITPGGISLIPKMKRFSYKADFTSGLIAYDKVYMYTSLYSLQKVLGYKEKSYDGIHIYSKNPFEDIKKIEKQLPQNMQIVGWWQQNGNFFSALALEKRAMFIVLMLIILVASLNIISSLLMTVMNRRSEIALLLSLGATQKEIKKTFFYLGSAIGGSGIVFGIILGFTGIWLLGNFDIVQLPADVYGQSKLPMELSLSDFFLIVAGAISIVAFSSYYPARKATEIDALQVLRNE